ncbi:MAG TPA: mannosyltransferase family protein [Actinomycetota bacterium]|nr:mannosyltransferase family protein [Actinomycetota bacterium]
MRTEEEDASRSQAVPDSRQAERARIVRGIRYCLAVFLSVRVALSVLALLAVALLPHSSAIGEAAGIPVPVNVPGWPASTITPGWHNLITAWERFDALWFLRIATAGYAPGDGSAAFFPLYPILIWVVSPILGGHPLGAALLISNAAFLGALIVLYFLTSSEFDERIARRTVLYLAIFPSAYFLLAPYSESLFLLLVVASLWAARREKWALAGVTGALAAVTRNVGVLLVLPLAVEGIHQFRERGGRLAPRLLWSGAVAVGTLAYLGFWQGFGGDALAPLHQQATWQREAAEICLWMIGCVPFPPATLLRGTGEAFRWIGQYPGGYHLFDWLLVVPALVAAAWATMRARPTFSVYAWASLIAPLSLVFPPRPFMSIARFLLAAFPLFWAAAVWAGRRAGVHEAVVAVSAAGLGVMTVLFVNWYFVF